VRLNVELVAIERPDGVLVERLLDAGLRVLALHPNRVSSIARCEPCLRAGESICRSRRSLVGSLFPAAFAAVRLEEWARGGLLGVVS
jgi:hypothetical protein